MLSKDRLTSIEYDMFYVKPKFPLSRARDNDYSLELGCDYAISVISQGIVKGVKKRGKKQVGQNIYHQDLVFGKDL